MAVEERVKKIIAEQFRVEENDVVPEAKLVEDFGADSWDSVELMIAIEEEFEIEFPVEDAEKTQTVAAVIDFIKGRID